MMQKQAERVQVDYFPLVGGENLTDAALAIGKGQLRYSSNYETAETNGYRRIAGYERFDGRTKPSESQIVSIPFSNGNIMLGGLHTGDSIITGVTSGAAGRFIAYSLDSGSFDSGTAAGTLALGNVTGAFQSGETVRKGLYDACVVSGTPVADYAPTDALYTQWIRLTIEFNRTQIQKVTGSGAILGVWVYKGVVYAFRNAADGLSAKMYKSTTSGWSLVTTPTLQPSGKYRFANYNFLGASGSEKMYGVDGVNKGFVFDGTTFTQITTGMATDKPVDLIPHKYHLFYAFAGGSVQHSSIGDPTTWTPVTGAGEIAVGQEITGFSTLQGEALAIFCRNSTYLLYGSSSADWNLKTHSLESGAIANTVQAMHTPLYLDDYGLTSLEQTQAYGDFVSNSYSRQVQNLIDLLKNSVTASMRVKSKDQYRLFFTDGSALVAKMESPQKWVYTRMNLPLVVKTCCALESDTASDLLFFGSDDGYVYQMDSGTSFDGAEIKAVLRLPFNHLKSPRTIKSFKKAILEMDAPEQVSLRFAPEFSYGNVDVPVSSAQDLTVLTGGGYWDSAVWDSFLWSAQSVGTAEAYLFGSGTNISLIISSTGTYEKPHTLQSVLLQYTSRGIKT